MRRHSAASCGANGFPQLPQHCLVPNLQIEGRVHIEDDMFFDIIVQLSAIIAHGKKAYTNNIWLCGLSLATPIACSLPVRD